MTPVECARGHEVVTAIVSGRWHETSSQHRAHVDGCEACRELAVVATLFHEDREGVDHHAHLPAAGQVWWRAAIRGRLEVQQAAARPLVWLYGVAGAVALGLVAAVAGAVGPAMEGASGWLVVNGATSPLWRWAAGLAEAAQPVLPLVLGVTAGLLLLLLLPVLYVAFSDD